ncbi:homoserine O-acetyltransferase [Sphingobacteriaceae bacterium]|nr:homoserine O-acetyltransferase [Sphingobacteriaceae bacterium]
MSESIFKYHKNFPLENGGSIPALEIVYHTYGTLNADRSNVIWVAHALTANSNVFDWWNGLFGENSFYNAKDYFIVCANNLGSCYGTTGPLSHNSHINAAWFDYFPQITIKDMVQTFDLLRQHLGLEKIHTLIGGSQGGQIALEWSLSHPDLAEHLILVATNAQHSPWGIAFNESQRLAIKADRTYYSNTHDGGVKGLAAARSMALLSYRGYETYAQTQKDAQVEKTRNFNAASYQRYQGEKLVQRFNAYSYVRLLDAMDSHNISRGRNSGLEEVLATVKSQTLVISVSSDILFPVSEQKFLAEHIKDSTYASIDSAYGHDGFLIETEKLAQLISSFYKSRKKNPAAKKESRKQNLLISL